MSLRYNKEPLGVYIPFEENTTAYNIIYDSTYKSFQEYNKLLKEGIKPEEARAVLPTSTMSVMGITFNVESFRHICKARINKKAQPVTSDVILKMYNLTRNIFPFNLVEVEK
jgi:thymidylate synthase (FAD)